MKNLLALLLLGTMLILNSCKKDTLITQSNLLEGYDNHVIVKWNETFLEVERYAAGYRPGPAPRALGLIGLANYEACLSGMPDFNSIATLYSGLNIPKPEAGVRLYYPAVINACYGEMMRNFFPSVPADKFNLIQTTESFLESSFGNTPGLEKSIAYGKAVAQAVWNWSKTDTYGHDAYKDPFGSYDWQAAYKKEGDWKPTTPGPGKPMFPNWGKVRTFAISESDKLCQKPIPYSSNKNSTYYNQMDELYIRSSPATQTQEDKWVAEFWSDDLVNVTFSPGPRWLAIATQVYKSEDCNLETAIWCNAKLGMALSDAAVACWHSKYIYNVERPATFINKYIDPTYISALNHPITGDKGITPSFPAYPSGHSTMGGAGAEVLSSVFGYDYAMTDRCHEGRQDFISNPRSFATFYDMAYENAISRVPLGVHIEQDCTVGVNLGYKCGRKVNQLQWKK